MTILQTMKIFYKKNSLKVCFLIFILLTSVLFTTGCINSEEKKVEKALLPQIETDNSCILPDWKDGEYHDYLGTTQTLMDFNRNYPELTELLSIGKSVLGKKIWCIKITNEKNNTNKYSCLIDGCIHGNEWEAGEACLYLAEYLLINFDKNKTVANILNSSIVYILPLLNPDGRDNDERWNENGIDLNRNFDVHFGRIKGGSIPLGKILGFIKIPYITRPKIIEKIGLDKYVTNQFWTNSGRRAFSEPETRSLRDFMKTIGPNFSFYVNCHTALHGISSIVGISHKPEFKPTTQEINVLRSILKWFSENTEYNIAYPDEFSFYGAGFAHHWAFKEFRVPAFCFEMLNTDYEPMFEHGKHDNLVHWMKTTIPVFMFLLINIKQLNGWQEPSIRPSLPEGIPPEPLK